MVTRDIPLLASGSSQPRAMGGVCHDIQVPIPGTSPRRPRFTGPPKCRPGRNNQNQTSVIYLNLIRFGEVPHEGRDGYSRYTFISLRF
jgi:hypothetical protein